MPSVWSVNKPFSCARPSITYCTGKHIVGAVCATEREPKLNWKKKKICKRETTRTEVKLNSLRRAVVVIVAIFSSLLALAPVRSLARCRYPRILFFSLIASSIKWDMQLLYTIGQWLSVRCRIFHSSVVIRACNSLLRNAKKNVFVIFSII